MHQPSQMQSPASRDTEVIGSFITAPRDQGSSSTLRQATSLLDTSGGQPYLACQSPAPPMSQGAARRAFQHRIAADISASLGRLPRSSRQLAPPQRYIIELLPGKMPVARHFPLASSARMSNSILAG